LDHTNSENGLGFGSQEKRLSVGPQVRVNISVVAMSDTSPEARAKQLEIVRAMSGEERMTLAYEMSMFARELAKEGIRRRHPDWSEAQVDREWLRLAFLPEPLPRGLR